MRLIDADNLIPMIRYATIDSEVGIFPILIGFDAIKKVVDEAPTIDAEPVVRCKDCKHYTLHCSWNGEKRYWCELDILHDGENGFCSWGAKMDEVKNETN